MVYLGKDGQRKKKEQVTEVDGASKTWIQKVRDGWKAKGMKEESWELTEKARDEWGCQRSIKKARDGIKKL